LSAGGAESIHHTFFQRPGGGLRRPAGNEFFRGFQLSSGREQPDHGVAAVDAGREKNGIGGDGPIQPLTQQDADIFREWAHGGKIRRVGRITGLHQSGKKQIDPSGS